jgi:hypothetical protein
MMMNETELLESAVSEYRGLLASGAGDGGGQVDAERLVRDLSHSHDWTEQGAEALVSLANDYGAFMLRNALALAVALNKEDGELGF